MLGRECQSCVLPRHLWSEKRGSLEQTDSSRHYRFIRKLRSRSTEQMSVEVNYLGEQITLWDWICCNITVTETFIPLLWHINHYKRCQCHRIIQLPLEERIVTIVIYNNELALTAQEFSTWNFWYCLPIWQGNFRYDSTSHFQHSDYIETNHMDPIYFSLSAIEDNYLPKISFANSARLHSPH